MTEVIPFQAQDITCSDYETFEQYANRVYKATKKPLRYKDSTVDEDGTLVNPYGVPIEVNPDLHYAFLMLGLTRLGTPQEFEMLFGAIMLVVQQMEQAGHLPEGWVRSVATPFNIKCPRIPEQFADDIARAVTKAYLTGDAAISVTRIIPPLEPEPEPEEQIRREL
jgi:hypothetical protein